MLENKYSFENLDVWQNASLFASIVHIHTSELPEKEGCGMSCQMQRASVSKG